MMKARVVFVDDEEPLLKAVKRLFRDFPYEIITFSDPMLALEQLPALKPEVIVSDFRMSKMDGVTLLETAAKTTPGSMRILLTGFADVGIAQSAINGAKVFRFLTKPWQGPELHAAVESALYELDRRLEENWALTAERESNRVLMAMNETLKIKLEDNQGASAQHDRAVRAQIGSTTRGLLTALELRSSGIYASSSRVAHLAVKMVELAREDWSREMAVLSGLLLDVGYLAMPEIPRWSGGQQALKHHCELGARLLQSANFPPKVIEAVRAHHENWDGSGPFGLAGIQIPFLARCLRIADMITSTLAPYKATDTLPDEAVIACIDNANSRQLDPALSRLAIGEIKARGARALFPARPPEIPELESLNFEID